MTAMIVMTVMTVMTATMAMRQDLEERAMIKTMETDPVPITTLETTTEMTATMAKKERHQILKDHHITD